MAGEEGCAEMTDIVARLLAKPYRPTRPIDLGNGTTVTGMGLMYSWEDDELRKLAAEEIRRLRRALELCCETFDSGPTTVFEGYAIAAAELRRRMEIAGEALRAVEQK